jgi:hypothetical protein
MPIDFKKEQKELYQPKTTPSIIDVPEMVFIAVDGKGDPNTSAEYAAAIETLYGLSYSIKMNNMTRIPGLGQREHQVSRIFIELLEIASEYEFLILKGGVADRRNQKFAAVLM